MRPALLSCLLLAGLSGATALGAAEPMPAGKALDALFAAEWERGLVESPENASGIGDRRFNDRWSDISPAAIAASQQADRAALAALQAIDRVALTADQQLDYDTFLWQLRRALERQKFKEYLRPVGHSGGVQNIDSMVELLPFASARDYRDWLKRMQAVPKLLDQTMVLMRQGAETGNTPPRVLMQRVPAQIAAQIVADPTRSPFYRPFATMPAGIAAAERDALQAEARQVIGEQIVPAYRRFGTFFDKDYLPRTRTSTAAAALPDGKAYYDFLARYYTTTELDAARIHQTGLDEVKRIRARMEEVKAETGFKGSMEAFFAFLRSDPRFFEKTPGALLLHYQALSKRIDPELVKISGMIPRLPYGVRPIPDNQAPDTTTAYYQPGAADGSRPGYYYVNLFKPEVRPTWEMVPLSLHEAVPGHHFQFARSMELGERPMFRRNAYFVAYSEGWALYAEQLGYDMGLYSDPYDRFGQLTYEMWRAVRLVIDTGMHSMDWTREQAITYFKANCAKTDQDIVNEVDRYIGTPGQALAYKIGQIRISALREKARLELGERYDLRAFNDAVLETGSVPLEALEKHIDAWIAARKAG